MSAVHQKLPVTINDLSGGLIDSEHVTQLALNQFEIYRNCYAVGKKLVGRPGTEKASSPAAASDFNSLRYYQVMDDVSPHLIVGTDVGFNLLVDPGSGTPATSVIENALASNSIPWQMRQYKNIMYAVREEATSAASILHRVVGVPSASRQTAGIIHPGVAPTLADGGAGVLPDGTYSYGVTFYNSTTGAESNISPISAIILAGGPKKVDLSAIPVAVGYPQVNARRIYRSLIDQSGIYYLVTTIADNVTTVYTDNNPASSLGNAASTENALPPTGLKGLESWQERLWSFGPEVPASASPLRGSRLYYSRALFPESWPATNLIDVDPDDGQDITALLADGKGKRLLVGKTGSIHEVTGVSAQNFRRDLVTSKHGVAGPECMTTAEGLVFFFSGENFYAMQSGGRDPQSISDVAIREIIKNIGAGARRFVRMSTYAPFSWMIALVNDAPASGHPRPTKMLVYNYKTGAWYTFDFSAYGTAIAPYYVHAALDVNGDPQLYFVVHDASYRYVYRFSEDVYGDDGTEVQSNARTKGISVDGKQICLSSASVLGRFHKDVASGFWYTTSVIDVSVYVDGVLAQGPRATALASSATPAVSKWRRLNLSTLQKPGSFLQLDVMVSNQGPRGYSPNRMEIAGLVLDCVVMDRKTKVA